MTNTNKRPVTKRKNTKQQNHKETLYKCVSEEEYDRIVAGKRIKNSTPQVDIITPLVEPDRLYKQRCSRYKPEKKLTISQLAHQYPLFILGWMFLLVLLPMTLYVFFYSTGAQIHYLAKIEQINRQYPNVHVQPEIYGENN